MVEFRRMCQETVAAQETVVAESRVKRGRLSQSVDDLDDLTASCQLWIRPRRDENTSFRLCLFKDDQEQNLARFRPILPRMPASKTRCLPTFLDKDEEKQPDKPFAAMKTNEEPQPVVVNILKQCGLHRYQVGFLYIN